MEADYVAACRKTLDEMQRAASEGRMAEAATLTHEAMRFGFLHHTATDLAKLTDEEWEGLKRKEDERRAGRAPGERSGANND